MALELGVICHCGARDDCGSVTTIAVQVPDRAVIQGRGGRTQRRLGGCVKRRVGWHVYCDLATRRLDTVAGRQSHGHSVPRAHVRLYRPVSRTQGCRCHPVHGSEILLARYCKDGSGSRSAATILARLFCLDPGLPPSPISLDGQCGPHRPRSFLSVQSGGSLRERERERGRGGKGGEVLGYLVRIILFSLDWQRTRSN